MIACLKLWSELEIKLDKFGYSGYNVRFDERSQFSLPNDKLGKKFVIPGVESESDETTIKAGAN